MKKLTVGIAVLLSGYAANSFAALPTGVSSRCEVSVPNYCGGFTFGLTGLYWRPSTPQSDFALTFPTLDFDPAVGFLFTNGHYHSVDHDYDWGWKANIGYVFPCSGNDVNLTYTHWDNDHHHHVDDFALLFPTVGAPFFGGDGVFLAPFDFPAGVTLTGTATVGAVAGFTFATEIVAPGTLVDIAFDPADLVGVSARSRFENHTWDLDFGQTINVGCNFRLRWFGGLRYSHLEHDLDVTHDFAAAGTLFTPTLVFTTLAPLTLVGPGGVGVSLAVGTIVPVFDFAATLRDVVDQKSDFNGIGPRFGFDASYHIGGGFGVVGSFSTALLVGEHEATFAERIETAGTIFLDPTATTLDLATTVGTAVVAVATGPTALVADPAFPVEVLSYKHPDETRVVPNIDAKLGIDWTYQFCNCSRTKLTIEAGYMVSHYFNAIDRLSAVGAFAPEFRTRQTIDMSFDGPYVGVQVNL